MIVWADWILKYSASVTTNETTETQDAVVDIPSCVQKYKTAICFSEVGIPAPYTTKSIAFKTTKETSKIVVEKQDRVTQPGLNVSSNSSHSQSQSLQSPPQPSTSVAGAKGSSEESKTPGGEGLGTMVITPLHVSWKGVLG